MADLTKEALLSARRRAILWQPRDPLDWDGINDTGQIDLTINGDFDKAMRQAEVIAEGDSRWIDRGACVRRQRPCESAPSTITRNEILHWTAWRPPVNLGVCAVHAVMLRGESPLSRCAWS
jgi:hypothetical protein